MIRRSSLALAAGICLVAGAAQFAGGAYMEAKAMVAQVLLERAWQRTLRSEDAVTPWSWADVSPVARLEVPRLGVSAVVLSGVSGEAMAFGPGHMDGTPMPGEPGLSVIAGHRDTHMAFLRDLKVGDVIVMTTRDGKRHRFQVEESRVVDADNHGLDFTAAGRQLALVTCWPFDSVIPGGAERYVLIANSSGQPPTTH